MENIEIIYESCTLNQFSFNISAFGHKKKFNIRMPDYFIFTEYDRHLLFLLVLPILSHLVAIHPVCKIKITDYIPLKAKDIFRSMVETINATDMFLLQKDITKPEIVWEEVDNKLNLSLLKQMIPEKYDTICYMSCGKDSTLAYCLMESLGEKILPYVTQYPTIAWNRGGQKHLDKYLPELKIFPHKAFVNINQQKQFYKNAFQKIFNQNMQNLESNQVTIVSDFDSVGRHFYSPSYHTISASISALIGTRFGVKNICPGDEKSLIGGYQGKPFSESLMFGQSVLFHNAISDMFKVYGLEIKVWSPVIMLNELCEWYFLDRFFYDKARIISSCLTQINRWCYMCEKCFYVYFYFLALDIDPMRYGFDKDKLYVKNEWFRNIKDYTDIIENTSHYAPNDKTWHYILTKIKNSVFMDSKLKEFINAQTIKPSVPKFIDEDNYCYVPIDYEERLRNKIKELSRGASWIMAST